MRIKIIQDDRYQSSSQSQSNEKKTSRLNVLEQCSKLNGIFFLENVYAVHCIFWKRGKGIERAYLSVHLFLASVLEGMMRFPRKEIKILPFAKYIQLIYVSHFIFIFKFGLSSFNNFELCIHEIPTTSNKLNDIIYGVTNVAVSSSSSSSLSSFK